MSGEWPGRPPLETMEARLQRLRADIDAWHRRSADLRHSPEALTTVDALTGLRNRFGILQSVEGALQWNDREGTPFAVMAVRVPELSEMLERRPATVADEATVHVAAVLSAGLRAVDRIGRWNETVFLLLLAKLADEEAAGRVSHRLASMLSAVPFMAGETRYRLTVLTACALVARGASPGAEEITRRLEGAIGSEDPARPEMLLFPPPNSRR